MIYLPDEWMNDLKNKDEIYDLLEEHTGCIRIDPDGEDEMIEARLMELGEYKILEEFRKGSLSE